MNNRTLVYSLIMIMALFVSFADAAGNLTATVKYKDSNGVDQPLTGAYVYLQDASDLPPMEQYFINATVIAGPSNASGSINVSVPEGTYNVRITKRNPQSGNTNRLGPPEIMDSTWNQINTIRISTNQTTALGTIYADYYAPIKVSGTVTRSGAPMVGQYVRLQTEPCYTDGYNYNVNQCGPVKITQRTNTNGQYTIKLRNSGTYYVYLSSCLSDHGQQYTGNPCVGSYVGSLTVQRGEQSTFNITQ